MAFVFLLEDGTGLAGANAYVDVAFCDDYHEGRGYTAWTQGTVTDLQKQAAIVRATDHMDRLWGRRYRGYKETDSQSLEWPRLDAYDDDDYGLDQLPPQLTAACAEYALRSLIVTVLAPDVPSPVPAQTFAFGDTTETSPSGVVNRFREKIGPLEEEVYYQVANGKTIEGDVPKYTSPDLLMQELLEALSNRIYRA